MAHHASMFTVASWLTAAGVLLALANWYVDPGFALAWMVVLAMFGVMGVALWRWRRAGSQEATPAAASALDSIPTAVVCAALMMGVPAALTLADSLGAFDGTDLALRATGVLVGIYLAMLGNVMPKNVPPLSSTSCGAARQQAFHRRAGWTWALCGLLSAIGWLALDVAYAAAASVGLMLTALGLTAFHLLRLRQPPGDQPAHGVN